MIVLHAGETGGELVLWGETGTPDPVNSGPIKRRCPRPHPAAAGSADLEGALAAADAGPGAQCCTAIAWLPSAAGAPVPSGPLLGEPPPGTEETELRPWQVPGCRLAAATAIKLLAACSGQRVLAPGLAIGADLAYWIAVLHMTGSLVARGRFLPELGRRNSGWQAEWRPHFQGSDAEWLARLAARMPSAARCLALEPGQGPPRRPAQAAARAFADAATDCLVRDAAGASNPARRRPRKPPASFASEHDAWLYALQSGSGSWPDRDGRAAGLNSQIATWKRPLAIAADSPFRLCFRLEEPAEFQLLGGDGLQMPRDGWYLRFLLQPHADPSLLIDLADVWKPGDAGAKTPGGPVSLESLLLTIGQAAALSRSVASGLDASSPGGACLETSTAHRFLAQEAAALEQAGFGVMLPSWWGRRGTAVRLATRARAGSAGMASPSQFSLDALVDVEWEIVLGDRALSLAELEELARLKIPLVRVRGQWVELSADEIAAAIDYWKGRKQDRIAVRDIVKLAFGAEAGESGLTNAGLQAEGWVDDLLGQLGGHETPELLAAPEEFAGQLRPYQARGYTWLEFLQRWSLGACLADDMGLGKTIQTLALLERDRQSGVGRPVLLACPTSVMDNWRREAGRFTPGISVLVHHGPRRKKGKAFRAAAAAHDLVVVSYGLLHRDARTLGSMAWRGVILDEAQNIKNPSTLQARAARDLRADYRVALTGTPVENHVGDLWSIMEFLNPGLLGTQAAFKRDYFVPIQALGDEPARERLRRATAPFILRRLKTDQTVISDLPEKLEAKVYCSLTTEQASLYKAAVDDLEQKLGESEGIGRRGLVLATITRLKQICNHPAQYLGGSTADPQRSGKLDRLTAMLEEMLAVGEKALVFTQFAAMGNLLRQHLQAAFGAEVLFLHGAIPRQQREQMVERFQTAGGPQIFILSLRAGGTGLNLTAANHVFHFDRWWNPAVESQATDRAFRIGQERNVLVHKYICSGTLEEKIDESFERKEGIARSIVGTGESWLTELGDDELRQVLALSHAVEAT